MDWTAPTIALMLLTTGLALAGPTAASHEEPTRVYETTIGDAPKPTTGYNTDGGGPAGFNVERVVDTFEIPDEHSYWYATVTELHLEGAEVDVNKWITVDEPNSHGYIVDNSNSGTGTAVRQCPPPAVFCTIDVGDGQEHWNLNGNNVQEGTYELELRGLTTAEYTVTIYGFDTVTDPID